MGVGTSVLPLWTPVVPLDREQKVVLERAHQAAVEYLADMHANRPARLAALRQYTQCGVPVPVAGGGVELVDPSRAINRYLAGDGTLTPGRCAMVRLLLKDIMLALMHAPQLTLSHLDVYTGVPHASYPDPDFGTPMPPTGPPTGDAIGWLRNRVVSASLDIHTAWTFARGGCCVFRLRVRPPMRLLPLWTTSAFPTELEVILPPGYQWRVVSKETVGTVEIHHLECTNPTAFSPRAALEIIMQAKTALDATAPGPGCGSMRQKAGDIVGPWVGGQHAP